jgi:hypothetical protein
VIAQGVTERRQEISVRMARSVRRPGTSFDCSFDTASSSWRRDRVRDRRRGGGGPDPPESRLRGHGDGSATLGAVVALLAVITLAASYLPARSATHVDPLAGLRSE